MYLFTNPAVFFNVVQNAFDPSTPSLWISTWYINFTLTGSDGQRKLVKKKIKLRMELQKKLFDMAYFFV